MARYWEDRGKQRYHALGECSETRSFDAAKIEAETWFKDCERGVSDRQEDGAAATVGKACQAYVRALRAEGRTATSPSSTTIPPSTWS